MERTRGSVLPQVTETALRWDKYYDSNGDYTNTIERSSSYVPLSGYTTMTDVVIDRFYERSSKGEVFVNPMTQYTEQINLFPATTSYTLHYEGTGTKVVTTGERYRSDLSFMEVPTTVLEYCEDLSSRALTSAFANASTSKASSLVTLGEGKETVTGVADVFRRLLRILIAVKKKQFKALKKELAPSEMADFWMEVRYGLRPIAFDLKQLSDAWVDSTEKGTRMTSRGFEKYSYNQDVDEVVPSTGFDFDYNRTLAFEYTARAGVLSSIDRINKFGVFGFADPIEAIYDLTTLSFVVDWFFNVGDTIAAHTPEANLTTLGAWTVETTTVKQTVRLVGISNLSKNPPSYYTGSWHSIAPNVRTSKKVVRTPHTRASYLPRLKFNLNWVKLVDLCIIGRNIMKTIKSNDVRISRHGRIR